MVTLSLTSWAGEGHAWDLHSARSHERRPLSVYVGNPGSIAIQAKKALSNNTWRWARGAQAAVCSCRTARAERSQRQARGRALSGGPQIAQRRWGETANGEHTSGGPRRVWRMHAAVSRANTRRSSERAATAGATQSEGAQGAAFSCGAAPAPRPTTHGTSSKSAFWCRGLVAGGRGSMLAIEDVGARVPSLLRTPAPAQP